ncbi:MAG: type IVB secretion system protein IcmH/DotU [Gemmatimonadota bacterium]|jgi:type VI secretion system protein ImpK
MANHTQDTIAETAARIPVRRGELALGLQEVLTVVCRLRAGRTVGGDPVVFRERVKRWLATAAREARNKGYSQEAIVRAGYGLIAFLDESVLNSSDPMFAEWHRRPLQEEIFGEFLGGERFFQNLDDLQREPDSDELADVLEVYLLCLALGFQGQYAAMGPSGRQELRHYWERGRDRVVGIRGAWGELSPSWSIPPLETGPKELDGVTKWLLAGSAAGLGLFGILWVVFFMVLRQGA